MHPSFKVLGGAEVTTSSLIGALKKTNHQTTLYTLLPPSIPETDNFKIKKIKIKFSKLFKTYQKYDNERKKIFQESENEDVVIIIGPGFIFEQSKVPKIILYLHGPLQDEIDMVNTKFKGWRAIYYKKIQNDLRRRLDSLSDPNVTLITNSNFTKNSLTKITKNECKVIYPPVQVSKFLKNFFNKKDKKIVTLCRFGPRKKLDFALDVMIGTDFNYQLSGYAKRDIQIEIFTKLKKKANHYQNITVTKNLSDEEPISFLSSAKVYFHPCEESFGISVIEAIASGCIPIVPNNSAHLETVPFEELRFDTRAEACEKLQKAMNSEYDNYKSDLKNHIEQFSEENFEKKMITQIEQ